MRKDVRLGAAIGAILIAVVVVWAIVASKGHNNKKDQVALDQGKATSPAGESTGGADRPDPATPGDALTAVNHEPLTISGGGGSILAPTPSHTDDAPAPTPDAAIGRSSANWAALLSAETPVLSRTPDSEHLGADAPAPRSTDTPAADGVIPAVNHPTNTHLADSPVPTGENIQPRTTVPASSSPERTSPPVIMSAGATHRVVSGETFSSIARATYGDAKYFKEIVKANPNVDPSHLKIGTVISLPDKSQVKREAPAARATTPATSGAAASTSTEARRHAPTAMTAVNPATEYRVQGNDNLYKISMKLYHSPNKVDAIYQLNKDLIGTDPGKLKLNMVLKLPEPPTAAASR